MSFISSNKNVKKGDDDMLWAPPPGVDPPTHMIITLFLFMALLISACTKSKPVAPLVQKGRTIYQAKCIACHNADPKLAGALGPEVKGASLELLKLRIKEGVYPQNYTPKRTTKLMVPMPELSEEDIKALHAYLNSP